MIGWEQGEDGQVAECRCALIVARAATDGDFDVVVIDTAPSRHAIDFVTYPARLAALLGGRSVAWLAGLAQRAQEMYRARVEAPDDGPAAVDSGDSQGSVEAS